jgi:adenylate cyclase
VSNEETADRKIGEITAWLMSTARLIDDTGALDQALIDALRGAGLPITRFMTGVPSLHPQIDSFSTLWEQGKGFTFRQFRTTDLSAQAKAQSPVFAAYDYGTSMRFRLTDPPQKDDYPIFGEMRDAGFTDYVALALPFGDGSFKAVTFATDRADGFTETHVAVLYGLRDALATTIEVRYLRHLAGTLMDTYVGPVAGRKVLEGAIKRGSGETIRAAIWFCDLKGFTALSESMPGQELIDILNSYFDVMTQAIDAEGGEVLKFIGDAVLAIFQPGEDGDTGAARRALVAASGAASQLEAVNLARREAGDRVIECGIALHFGDVLYGNVGGQKRLDFTVIGPAVNLASRIESLTRELSRPVLVSRAFAELHDGDFEPMGTFALKGIADEHEVFAPRSQG